MLEADILAACERFRSAADSDEALLVRHSALLALAVAFLQHFVRANWTGPPEQADQWFMIIGLPGLAQPWVLAELCRFGTYGTSDMLN